MLLEHKSGAAETDVTYDYGKLINRVEAFLSEKILILVEQMFAHCSGCPNQSRPHTLIC